MFPTILTRKLTAVGAALSCSIVLVACGSSDPSETADQSSDGKFVVYSPQGDGTRGDFMTTRAKEELGVDVQFVTGGGGDLTSRIKQEKHNSQADLVLGVGEAQLAELDAEGLFEPYTPEWADKIPSEFAREDAGYTLFSQTPVVMAYNPEVMSESEAPSRWEDLAKPEYKDKFVLPSVTGQTGQAFMVGVLWRYADPVTGEVSDEGWETLEGIMSNSLQLAQGEKFDWNRVVSGEVPIHVSWLGGIQVAAEDFGITMEPIDAEGGSPFVNTGVGVIKGGDTGQAQEFIDWFGSAQLQTEFVNETNNDTPLNEDALKNLPEQRASIESVTPQEIDWAVVSENLTEWMQRVQLQVI